MLKVILRLLGSAFRARQSLALESFALRHQLYVLQRPRSRIRLKKRDRLVWVVPPRIWGDWRESLTIVQPETVSPVAPSGVPALLEVEEPTPRTTAYAS
jgi:hypothetical protein